ncbi:VOC family protein [Arthrobacter sp. JSM 101049]|uniref:VOC family protein n=1 Tax=Arthrobacter sp. JSM 101049 TaxID=929097 RepID=UPI0035688F6D
MLLDGINHIALLSHDVERLGRFYETVFDAVVGPTRDHGPGETMTSIKIGSATELNVFVIEGNAEADRQTPMWGRGRIDHLGLAAASDEAFEAIRTRLIDAGASDGKVNDFGKEFSIFFRDPDGLEGEVLNRKSDA